MANNWRGNSLLLLLLLLLFSFHDTFFPLFTYLVCKSKETVLSAVYFNFYTSKENTALTKGLLPHREAEIVLSVIKPTHLPKAC